MYIVHNSIGESLVSFIHLISAISLANSLNKCYYILTGNKERPDRGSSRTHGVKNKQGRHLNPVRADAAATDILLELPPQKI